MLSLSRTTGYAIKALSCLNEPACQCQQTLAVAQCANVPKAYLIKIVQSLARNGLVVVKRGLGGGIQLARSPEQISILQIVEAVEGPLWLGECLLGLDDCSIQTTCPTHAFWQRIRREIREELARTTLAEVIAFKAKSKLKTRPSATPKRRAVGRSCA